MSSLIIVVIAIALAILITLATMYFGGDTVTSGTREAEIAKAVNELGQIQAANTAYKVNEGKDPESMADLIPGYLTSAPLGWGVDTPNTIVFEAKNFRPGTPTENRSSCAQVNTKLGIADRYVDTGGVPLCADIPKGFYGCCEVPETVEAQP